MKFGSITTGIIADGLVFNMDAANKACYPRTGTTVTDTIHNNIGTLSSTTFESTNNGVFNFDGIDDDINFGNVLSNLVNLSLECWIKFGEQDSSYNGVISKTAGNHDGWEIRTTNIRTSTQTQVHFRYKGDTSSTSGVTLDNGVWYNIVGTGESGAQKLYVNGTILSSATGAATPTPNSNLLYIGALSYITSLKLTGDIAAVRIYNRALSANEVLHNYNALKGRFE